MTSAGGGRRRPRERGSPLLGDPSSGPPGEGRRVPIYFDGQSFGVSIVETGAVAGVFRVAGVSVLAVKGAVFLVWVAGWWWFVLGLRQWTGDRTIALVGGLLLATMPVWGNWSMMARGYHLGAFATAQALFWSLGRLRRSDASSPLGMLVAGALGIGTPSG